MSVYFKTYCLLIHCSFLVFKMKTSIRSGLAKELHKQARKNYPRRNVQLKGMNDLYQADLVDMIKFSRWNKGYKYILTIINCFTKLAFALPIKTKSGLEISKVLDPILQMYPMKHFQTDQGTEFFNSYVRNLLKKYNINHYHTFSDKKASIVERFNRTLKSKMWIMFSEQGNYHWLSNLQSLVFKYNNTVHRTIGLKPIDVTKHNERKVLQNIIRSQKKYIFKQKFSVGDRVRISRRQNEFSKGYWPRWSNEIFTVWKVQFTNPATYILKDDKGEIVKGGFYEQELSVTKFSDTYLIEKVVRKNKDKVLVRWLGFDKSHDSWIDKSDLIK